MRGLRVLGCAVITGALLSSGVAIAHSDPAPRAVGEPGIAYLLTNLDLQPTASGTWTNSGLAVTLSEPGTYDLDVDVRGAIAGIPPFNAFITARLWNATTGTVVDGSERIVVHVIDHNTGAARTGTNDTAPISERITVDRAPTRIVLQAQRTLAAGQTTLAGIFSNAAGRTSFRFLSVTP